MEGFLLGDKGPEVFYEVQVDVVKTLEEKFYPSFLVSEFYQKMQGAMEEESAAEKADSGKFLC
jgi:sorting nexin-25